MSEVRLMSFRPEHPGAWSEFAESRIVANIQPRKGGKIAAHVLDEDTALNLLRELADAIAIVRRVNRERAQKRNPR